MHLEARDLCVRYGETTVLHDISFRTDGGEILCLLGPNGSGKSTLIRTLARLIEPAAGHLTVGGKEYREVGLGDFSRIAGYVPQSFTYLPSATVFETVMIGRKPHISWDITPRDIEVIDASMQAVGVHRLAHKFITDISGGERQKVFIARALSQEPSIFLFDEPTSSLDIRHQIEVLELMRRITRERGAILVIALHDLNLACHYADKVLLLRGGRVYAYGPTGDALTTDVIEEVYGVQVLRFGDGSGEYLVPAWNVATCRS